MQRRMKVMGQESIERIKSALAGTMPQLALVALVGLLVYGNSLDSSFHFDDANIIVNNPIIKDAGYFTGNLDAREIYSPFKSHILRIFSSRYLGYLSFLLNYQLHGLDVRGYHILNLAIHIMNSFFVYFLVRLSFLSPKLRNAPLAVSARSIALVSSLLFVSHPVQTQAVTYITQRFTSLATMFYLGSIVFYMRYRLESEKEDSPAKWYSAWHIGAIIFAVCAMKTKEIALTLPLMAAFTEFVFFEGGRSRRIRLLAPLLLTIFIIPITFVITSTGGEGMAVGNLNEASRMMSTMPRTTYFITQLRVIVTYLRLLIFPTDQNFDYDYPVFDSMLSPQIILSTALLCMMFGIAGYCARASNKTRPELCLVSFGIFWFFIALSVESSVIPIGDVIFEHRIYLPSAGFFIMVSTALFLLADRHFGLQSRTVIALSCVVCVCALSIASYNRNEVWKNELTLWKDVVNKSPNKGRPLNKLAEVYFLNNNFDGAIELSKKALLTAPGFAEASFNIGNSYFAKGMMYDAVSAYKETIRLNPEIMEAHHNLAYAYEVLGLATDAEREYRIASDLEHNKTPY